MVSTLTTRFHYSLNVKWELWPKFLRAYELLSYCTAMEMPSRVSAKSWFIFSDLKSTLESGWSKTSIPEISKPKFRKFMICSGSQNLVYEQQNLSSLHHLPMLELSFCQLVIVFTGYCCYFMNFYLLKPSKYT